MTLDELLDGVKNLPEKEKNIFLNSLETDARTKLSKGDLIGMQIYYRAMFNLGVIGNIPKSVQ